MRTIEGIEYISVAEIKARLSEKIKDTESAGRRYAVTSHGKPKAVLISYKDYLALTETEPRGSRELSLDAREKDKKARESVLDAVSKMFDADLLSRKGQKEYKKNGVQKISRVKKITG